MSIFVNLFYSSTRQHCSSSVVVPRCCTNSYSALLQMMKCMTMKVISFVPLLSRAAHAISMVATRMVGYEEGHMHRRAVSLHGESLRMPIRKIQCSHAHATGHYLLRMPIRISLLNADNLRVCSPMMKNTC
jgi:hypothetical protein